MSFCEQLHSLGSFFELPALERLIARNCISLIEVCESIEHCVELVHIDLSYCYKLKRLPMSIGRLKKVKTLLLDGCNFCESLIEEREMDSSDMLVPRIGVNSQPSSSAILEAIPSDLKFFAISLPSSLVTLSIRNSNLHSESFPMDFSCLSMLVDLYLDGNPIVSMPNCVRSLPMLEKLSMKNCEMLVSIEHPPCTLKELSIISDSRVLKDYKTSLRKIVFDPKMSPLNLLGASKLLSPSSYEIDGMVKIQPMTSVREKELHSLGWTNLEFIKKTCLGNNSYYGSEAPQIQMYYEFGIFSTIYGGERMPNWIKLRSEGASISFTIPSSPKNLRGFNFCCVETFSDMRFHFWFQFWLPRIEISNITKSHTWKYYHYVDRVKSRAKFVTFLSHWMFGTNEMEDGDQITITVTQQFDYQFTKECGVSFLYDDGRLEEEEDPLGYYKSWNHIIGSDLSAFQTTTGVYILDNSHFSRVYSFRSRRHLS